MLDGNAIVFPADLQSGVSDYARAIIWKTRCAVRRGDIGGVLDGGAIESEYPYLHIVKFKYERGDFEGNN